LEKLSQNIKIVLHFGIRPVVVINFINTLKTEEEIDAAYKTIFEQSSLNKNDIFMIDNYEHEVYRNMEKDLSFRKILSQAFKQGLNTIRKKPQLSIRPVPPVEQKVYVEVEEPGLRKNLCQTTACQEFGKEVITPKCAYCGTAPLPAEQKVCPTAGCPHERKVLKTPMCAFCGAPGIDSRSASSMEKICVRNGCENAGKAVTTPRCGFCGDITVPRSAVKKPSIRTCPKVGCINHGKEIPAQFPRCGQCGSLIGSEPVSRPPDVIRCRKCINIKCSHYNDLVPKADFLLCPYCGSEPGMV